MTTLIITFRFSCESVLNQTHLAGIKSPCLMRLCNATSTHNKQGCYPSPPNVSRTTDEQWCPGDWFFIMTRLLSILGQLPQIISTQHFLQTPWFMLQAVLLWNTNKCSHKATEQWMWARLLNCEITETTETSHGAVNSTKTVWYGVCEVIRNMYTVTLRLPWLRFVRAFPSVVRQMPG